jgi:hypothetical protein
LNKDYQFHFKKAAMNNNLESEAERLKNEALVRLKEENERLKDKLLDSCIEYSAALSRIKELEQQSGLRWVKAEEDLPPECTIVWGYSLKWVDEDYNPEGVRECFYNDNLWNSAKWCNEQDAWDNDETNPTHWMRLPEPPTELEQQLHCKDDLVTGIESIVSEFHEWQLVTFPDATPISELKHLEKEITELINELALDNWIPDEDAIKKEYADCFALLFGSAFVYGLSMADIAKAMAEKLEVNKKRKWGTPDKDGGVYHIKERLEESDNKKES